MGQRFVEGLGLYTTDDNLSEEEIQANIQFKRDTTPVYAEQTFATGFNDTQSMVYRWWQKLSDEENEAGRWLEGQVKEWGQHTGYYDSIALEAYFTEIANVRELNGTEMSDRQVNREQMAEFKTDMMSVYENNNGDVTEVQKKYGYTPEDIGVIDGIMAMMQNPSATAGAFTGMLVKDPEMLLINFLRIPTIVARGTELARKTITAATRMQPKYVQKLASGMTSARAGNMVGRGVEGAAYGGVYEALHDLTFKGKVDPTNVKRGASLGFLLGTAFGAITPTSSKSWFVDRVGSKNAEKKWQSQRLNDRAEQVKLSERWEQTSRPAPESKPLIFDPKKVPKFNQPNKDFRPTPKQAILPEGLTHEGRYDFWLNDAKEVMVALRKPITNDATKLYGDTALKLLIPRIDKLAEKLLKKKNAEGSSLFTPAEARGLAARHQAEVISGQRNPERWWVRNENARTNPQKDRKWGAYEEFDVGQKNISKPDYKAPPKNPEDFNVILPEIDIMSKAGKASGSKIAKAAAIGAVASALYVDEDKTMAAFMGALTFGLARGTIFKGINVQKAKMKQVGHKIADQGKLLEEGMQKDATMVGKLIQRIIKEPAQQKEFLSNVENFSKVYKKKLEGKYKTHKEYIAAKHGVEYLESVTAYHNSMEKFWRMANEAGVLRDESHIVDYVTHIFGKEITTKERIQLNAAFNELGASKKFNFANQRKIFETIEQIGKDRNIVFDPVKIIAGYTQSLQKILAGKEIVKHMDGTGYRIGNDVIGISVDIANVADAKLARANGYRASEMPALKGKLLHPLIKKAIEDFYSPSIGSTGFAGKAAVLNNAMKRIVLSASLFHAQALLLSGIYAGGLTHRFTKEGIATRKKVKAFLDARYDLNAVMRDNNGKVIKVRNMDGDLVDLKGDFVHAEMIREIVEARLGIGSAKTNELTNAGYRTVKDFLDRRLKPLGKFQDMVDRITWDGIHDHSKMFTYLTMKERLMSGKARGIERFLTPEEGTTKIPEPQARLMAAQFANDAYGGQNFNALSLQWEQLAIENASNPKGVFYQWAAMAATPTKKSLSNWLLLSPDWTISNINIGFKGLGMTKNLGSKVLAGKKLTAKEMGEWNMYMGYMFRAGVSTSMFAYVIHKTFADEGQEFNLKDFWYTGRLPLGNGEELVISKQIAEPMHWVTSPMHTALNKGASLPKAAMEIMFGKQWVSLKHGGSITGPTFNKADPKDWATWFGNKVTPISISPFKQALTDDDVPVGYKMFEKAVLGFVGFPRYGKPDNKSKFKIY